MLWVYAAPMTVSAGVSSVMLIRRGGAMRKFASNPVSRLVPTLVADLPISSAAPRKRPDDALIDRVFSKNDFVEEFYRAAKGGTSRQTDVSGTMRPPASIVRGAQATRFVRLAAILNGAHTFFGHLSLRKRFKGQERVAALQGPARSPFVALFTDKRKGAHSPVS
jgi:hypothetical protein